MRSLSFKALIILITLISVFVACDLIESSSQSKFDTDIPESEEFDAYYGTWSADGNSIAFIHSEPLDGAEPGKLDQVWIYNFETEERRKIINGRALSPNIHPNGQLVLFHTKSIPETIFKVGINGMGLTQLTGEGSQNDFKNTTTPEYSPNGDEILFTIFAGTPRGISVMDTTGANAEIIVPFGISGDWFPDGERIVYVNWDTTAAAGQRRQIYTANKDGSNQTKITNFKNSDLVSAPDVSPDGKQITFAHRGEDNSLEIFVMDVEGTNIRQLTEEEGKAVIPVWHPNGESILFHRSVLLSATETLRRLWLVDVETLEVTPVFPRK